MTDESKTKTELIAELQTLRERLGVLENAVAESDKVAEVLSGLTQAIDTMELGVTVTDVEGRILYSNRADAEMHGYLSQDLVGRKASIFAPVAKQRPMEPGELRSAAGWKRTGINVRRDGSTFPVHLTSEVVRDPNGEPLGLVTVCKDLTERRAVEKELQASEEKYRGLFDNSRGLICTHDLSGTVTAVNPAAATLLGYDAEELVGRPLTTIIDPAARHEFSDYLKRIRETGEDSGFMRVVTRTGERRTWLFRNTLHRDPARGAYVVGHAQDVTALKQAEDALRKSQTRLQLVNCVATGITTGSSTRDTVALTVEQLGTVFSELRVVFFEVDRDGRAHLVKSHRPEAFPGGDGGDWDLHEAADYFDDLRRGRSVIVEDVEQDLRLAKMRSTLSSAGARAILEAPITQGNELVGILCLHSSEPRKWDMYEITLLSEVGNYLSVAMRDTRERDERRKAEEELRRSEAEYRALISHATYGVYRTSVDGTFRVVNEALATMLGYESEEEVLALDLAEDVFVDAAEYSWLIKRYSEEERIDEAEVEWKRKDGAPIPVRMNGRVVRGPGGETSGWEMVVEDISERRSLEEQLRQSQKMESVGQLTGGIAHDFNNILTVILASARLLRAQAPPANAEMQVDLDELESAARRGSALVRRLLSFSRRAMLSLEPLDLGALTGDLLQTLRRLLPETIDIRVITADGLPNISADAGAVEQILLNLATNARDAMPLGGVLRVETSVVQLDEEHRERLGWGDPGEYVGLSVSDTGVGMSEEVTRKIFEPFFTTKAQGQGTGLGMSTVYGLMKQHNGFVDVSSEVGRGTTVTVYFPRATEDVSSEKRVSDLTEAPRGSETILFVEDEAPIRRAGKKVLELYGYTVLQAADGEEALRVLKGKKSAISLVISDVVMPKMSGPDLFEAVRHDLGTLKFILMSGYTAVDVHASIVSGTSLPLLQKPWTPNELLMRVRETLDRPN
ncbi:MAG: PAS domain S-box protein [Gemmatimonadales bacterium]